MKTQSKVNNSMGLPLAPQDLAFLCKVRYCEISAKRKDSDHHDIIDLTAFNTDGFDVSGKNVWIHDCQIWNQVKKINNNCHLS